MYMLEVAKEHQADLEAAAERGVLSTRYAIRVSTTARACGSSLQSVTLVVGCGTRRCCPARNETSG